MIILLIVGGSMVLLAMLYAIIILMAMSGVTLVREPGEREQETYPEITVIIPVRNESDTIVSCLESIARQDYPPDKFEVIISDDFSEDDTSEKVKKFIDNSLK